ncbi:CAP domain-containing protein, partial [Sediminihabitans luteus]
SGVTASVPSTVTPAVVLHAATRPTVRLGSRGSTVVVLQKRLRVHGWYVAADGVFGSKTLAAVRSFQRSVGLGSGGVVGPKTWAALGRSPAKTPPATLHGSLFAMTNWYRVRAGCKPLVADARLTSAAQRYATDMATHGYFSHTGRDGSTFVQRIKAAGYPSPGGENLARGQTTRTQVITDLMASTTHRANVVRCSFVRLGTARSGTYWVQEFGY